MFRAVDRALLNDNGLILDGDPCLRPGPPGLSDADKQKAETDEKVQKGPSVRQKSLSAKKEFTA